MQADIVAQSKFGNAPDSGTGEPTLVITPQNVTSPDIMAEKSQPRLTEKDSMAFDTGIRPNTAGSPQNFMQNNRNQQSANVMISRNNKRKG